MHNVVRGIMDGMDMDTAQQQDHASRAEEVRAHIAHELTGLIEVIKAELRDGATAGMTVALIAAYKELGRLYQTHERPGGRGLTETQVARMLAADRAQQRVELEAEQRASARLALERGAVDVREALAALSDKSLG